MIKGYIMNRTCLSIMGGGALKFTSPGPKLKIWFASEKQGWIETTSDNVKQEKKYKIQVQYSTKSIKSTTLHLFNFC